MRIKNLIKSTLPVLLCLFLYVIAYFAAFAITVLTGQVNVADASDANVNEGIYNLLKSILIFIFCGGWYWKIISTSNTLDNIFDHFKKTIRMLCKPLNLLMFCILGYGIQLGTDSILFILNDISGNALRSYNKMMFNYKTSTSYLLLFTIILVGPIAEELIFRGLTLHYTSKVFGVTKLGLFLANLLQALFFGIYHGNIVQFVYAFIFGMLLGSLTLKTRSILPSILLHILINSSLFITPDQFHSTALFALLMLVISLVGCIVSSIYIQFKCTLN